MDLFGRKEYDDKLRNQAKADLERSGNMPVIFNQETNHLGSQVTLIPGVDQSSNLGNVLDWKMQPVITDWEPVDNFDGNYKNIHVSTTVLLKKFSVESHITIGFSAFLNSIGVCEYVTSKNKIISRALFE